MDTFSPVAKMTSIRTLLTLATNNEWFLHQHDVNNAFLHGELHEEFFMKALKGYSIPPGKMLRLKKSLYGLKQANRQWYAKLPSSLLDWGFTLTPSNHSVFIKRHSIDSSAFIVLLIYVEDVIMVAIGLY